MIETFYVYLKFPAKTSWSVNLPFVCSKCGVCCTLEGFLTAGKITAPPDQYAAVHAQIRVLFDQLGELWEEDEAKYNQHIQHTPCPFKINNTCAIYEVRPLGCRMFPKTAFGMQSTDCPALVRFKKQRAMLVRGRRYTETYHRTVSLGQAVAEPLKPAHLSEKQYQKCLAKLQSAGASGEELAIFGWFNKNLTPSNKGALQ
jgi:Fe-S-cluster containining protein